MNEYHKTSKKQAYAPKNEASSRPSSRPDFLSQKSAEVAADAETKGGGSIPIPGIPSPVQAGDPRQAKSSKTMLSQPGKTTRLSRAQLVSIEAHLSPRDRAVLEAIRKYRFLTSSQIGRLYVTECSSKSSQTRQQNLLLKRLGDYGLIRPLERRVGGYGGGSSVQVWHLTEAGQRLLSLNDSGDQKRKRFSEPSALFLEHTLAIAECAVQMTCLCRNSADLVLEDVATEPACWRRFRDGEKIAFLKPDLFVITDYDNYEDRWFIEMDLGSESPVQVLEKCNAYLRYYYTGLEQRQTEMFPLVVWIVKDISRKESLKSYIRENLHDKPKMFLVITPDELENMLRQDIERKELC